MFAGSLSPPPRPAISSPNEDGDGQQTHVYVTRELPGDAVERLRQAASVRVWPEELPPPRDVLLREAAAADGLLALLTDRIDAELLDAAPRLRVVSNVAVGYDNIDVRRGHAAGHPGHQYAGYPDRDHRRLRLRPADGRRPSRGGGRPLHPPGRWKTWGPQVLLGQDVHGACLGIVGLGAIGLEVAKRARGFGMRILYHRYRRRPREERRYGLVHTELDQSCARPTSSASTCPSPARPATSSANESSPLMKPTAVLVNTARGPVVDQRGPVPFLKERAHHRRRPGRDGGGAHPHGRPPADAGQRHHRAPHRQRQRQYAARAWPR